MMSTDKGKAAPRHAYLVAVLLLFGTSPIAGAQGSPFSTPQASQQPTPDSAKALDRAKDAQRRFERVRIRHLPWQWGGWSGPCDERVGRMCWRHDDPEDSWVKPQDPQPLAQARDDLIAALAESGRIIPGDRWVLAQHVWYLGEANRWDEALSLTSECSGGDLPWCAALRGLALHETGRFAEAAHAFDEAGRVVDDMGGDSRADLRALVDGDAREPFEGTPAQPFDGLMADSLMWLLADPMYLVPGNDRRTEHSARRVVNRIRDGARNPYSLSWGKDMTELVIRYGWAVAWEKVRGSGAGSEPLAVVGRHPSKGRGFIPAGRVLSSLEAVSSKDLDPVARHPRTTYRPRYASVVRAKEAEVFVFDRGDSLLFIGAFSPSGDSLDTALTEEGAFAANLATGEVIAGRTVAPGRWIIHTVNAPHVISLERLPAHSLRPGTTINPDSAGTAWRYREAFPVGQTSQELVGLSDLMFLEPSGELRSLEDAARTLRGGQVRPGQTITVAWEVYGLGFDDAPLEYEVLVGKKGGGLLSTLGSWVGLGDGNEGILIDWSEAQPADPGPQLRHVSVTLPDVEEGTYVLRLALQMAGRSTVVQERELEVSLSR